MIITPKLPNEIIHPDVIQGVHSQSVKMPWYIHCLPESMENIAREVNININRHQCQVYLKDKLPPSSIVLLLDSDVIMEDPYTIEKLTDMLLSDSSLLAASVNTQVGIVDDNHILASCAVMKFSIYQLVRYMEIPAQCQCDKIKAMGGNDCIKYHLGIKAREQKYSI